MLVILQVTLIIIAFVLLAVSFNTKKVTNFWAYSMLAMILFGVLGLTSLEMEEIDCEGQTDGVNTYYVYGNNFTGYHWDYDYSDPPGAPDNNAYIFHTNTTNTNSINCTTTSVEEIGLAALMWTMAVLSMLWSLISLLIENTKAR